MGLAEVTVLAHLFKLNEPTTADVCYDDHRLGEEYTIIPFLFLRTVKRKEHKKRGIGLYTEPSRPLMPECGM